MPRRRRHRDDPAHRQRADRHRSGVRVRLLGHAGVPGAARRGLPRRARQLEPGDDHDRPRVRRRHLRRTARRPDADAHHREGASRRAAPDPRRPDRRSTSRSRCTRRVCSTEYGVEMIGANVEAIRTAEDRQRFKVAMTEIGLRVPPSGIAYSLDEAMIVADEVGYPGDRPARVHPRRRRHRHRVRHRRDAHLASGSPRRRPRRRARSRRS